MEMLFINKFKIALRNNSYPIVSLNKNQLFKNTIKTLENNFIFTYVDKVSVNHIIISYSILYFYQVLISIFLMILLMS